MKEKRKKKKKKQQQQQQKINKDRKEQRGDTSNSEDMRAKLFCCASAFLQLICKVSLVFESNLELALSIILKERDLY